LSGETSEALQGDWKYYDIIWYKVCVFGMYEYYLKLAFILNTVLDLFGVKFIL
jgi:hypothetical protein